MRLNSSWATIFCILTFTATQYVSADDPAKDAAKKDASASDSANDASAKESTKKDASATESAKNGGASKSSMHHTFLGVYVSSVHPAMAKHFRDLLSPEQGLVVEDVAEDSPASKAGIKEHDVLTTYDDQKLFSAEQLAKLVHSDKSGREVAIGFLRDGKSQKMQVKLGDVDSPRPRAWAHPHEHAAHHFNHQGEHQHPHAKKNDSAWENFDSLTLKKTGDNKFHAEVQYLDKDGKNQKHVFDGTRDEIKKSIESEKDLKPAERLHLLHSLNLTSFNDIFSPFQFYWVPDEGDFESFDDAS